MCAEGSGFPALLSQQLGGPQLQELCSPHAHTHKQSQAHMCTHVPAQTELRPGSPHTADLGGPHQHPLPWRRCNTWRAARSPWQGSPGRTAGRPHRQPWQECSPTRHPHLRLQQSEERDKSSAHQASVLQCSSQPCSTRWPHSPSPKLCVLPFPAQPQHNHPQGSATWGSTTGGRVSSWTLGSTTSQGNAKPPCLRSRA